MITLGSERINHVSRCKQKQRSGWDGPSLRNGRITWRSRPGGECVQIKHGNAVGVDTYEEDSDSDEVHSDSSFGLWRKKGRSEHFTTPKTDVTKTRNGNGDGNGEWEMENGEWGMGNGEWGMGNEVRV